MQWKHETLSVDSQQYQKEGSFPVLHMDRVSGDVGPCMPLHEGIGRIHSYNNCTVFLSWILAACFFVDCKTGSGTILSCTRCLPELFCRSGFRVLLGPLRIGLGLSTLKLSMQTIYTVVWHPKRSSQSYWKSKVQINSNNIFPTVKSLQYIFRCCYSFIAERCLPRCIARCAGMH